MTSDVALNLARQAISNGDKASARSILQNVIRVDPNNESALMLFVQVAEKPEHARYCLERVLQINPSNGQAAKWLEALNKIQPAKHLTPAPSPASQLARAPGAEPPPASALSSRPEIHEHQQIAADNETPKKKITAPPHKKTLSKQKANQKLNLILATISVVLLFGAGCLGVLILWLIFSPPDETTSQLTTPQATALPPTVVSNNVSAPTDISIPTHVPSPTDLSASDTPKPTKTSAPTNTPNPTSTPTLTPTYTPTFAPIILSGSGDSVVDVEKWDGPALARITYSGDSNFAVTNYGVAGNRIDLLVNIIGEYEGTRPLDFLDDEQTARFQIEASGQWEIQILPFEQIRFVTVPGTFDGRGDDVVFLDGPNPDLLIINASAANSNFVVWGYGQTRDLFVNEIAPYEGVVLANEDTNVLVIEAEGEWSIEVTTK